MLTKDLKKSFVEKLIVEYKNYMVFFEETKKLKLEILRLDGEERKVREEKLEFVTKIMNRLGDEMTFPTPSIWMMYKYFAYQGTDREIKNVRDFLDHCSPEGYICTRRYLFMKEYLNLEIFSKEMDLKEVFEGEMIEKLENDILFMNEWLKNEYNINDNKISKW